MGAWDTYCFLCGTPYTRSTAILEEMDEMDLPPMSKKLMRGLTLSRDDTKWTRFFVMIAPYESYRNGTPHTLLASFEDPHPTEYTPDNVTTVFHVVPSDVAEYGGYESLNPPKWDTSSGEYFVSSISTPLVIMRPAYNILLQAAPSTPPHMISRLYMEKAAERLDYGPINGVTGDQYVSWIGIHNSVRGSRFRSEKSERFWQNLLCAEGKTDDEILHDAWRGPGNLWALVRPDRFPVKETCMQSYMDLFAKGSRPVILSGTIFRLPPELIHRICDFMHPRSLQSFMSTSITALLMLADDANRICHQYIKENEPWYLPAGPFDIPHGDQEVKWWRARWKRKGIFGDDLDRRIPWLHYRRACSHSLSMWNRIRIWKVAKQLEALAEELD